LGKVRKRRIVSAHQFGDTLLTTIQSGAHRRSSVDPVYHDVSAVRCRISVSSGCEFGNRWCSGDEGVWERRTEHVIHNVVYSSFCLK